MSQNPSWRHHYIPEFYLKQWAAADGKLVEYSKPWAGIVKPKRVSPRETGFEDRLNDLAGLPDAARHSLETHFYSPVDSAAASVLLGLKSGRRSFNNRERLAWARFLTSLVVRNPENTKAAIARMAEVIREVEADIERRYQAERELSDPGTFKEYRQSKDLTDELARAAKRAIASVADTGLVVNHLLQMRWGVLDLPFDAPPLLSSDRPLAMTRGMPDPDCQVLLPIGPKSVFYAVNRDELAQSFDLDPAAIASAVNEMTVRRAVRYVYAMSDRHQAYVQEHMGTVADVPVSARKHPRAERRRRQREFKARRKLAGFGGME